jgi:lipoprotein-anchoring transpeptidase ErfK/SrfK
MMLRFRVLLGAVGAGLLAMGAVSPACAQISQYGMWGDKPPERSGPSFLGASPSMVKPMDLAGGGGRPFISPKTPKTASFPNGMQPGSIIIDTASRKLYFTLSQSSAYVYPIAVGKQGFTWTGVERVSRIEDWPDWIPPKEMRARKPGLPVRMTGGVKNPLGAKAIYLGNTLYRIHGTNDSESIGSAASSGCFRMHNEQVVHLAEHVQPGTVVYVFRRLPNGRVMPPASTIEVKAPQEAPPTASSPPAAQPAPPAPAEGQPAPQAPEAAPAPETSAPAQPADQGI